MDKQQTQYQLTTKKNEICSDITEASKIGKSRHLDSSTATQVPNSWSNIGDLVVLLERNLCGHPLAGLLWERQNEQSSTGNQDGKKYRHGNVYLCIDSKVGRNLTRKQSLGLVIWKVMRRMRGMMLRTGKQEG